MNRKPMRVGLSILCVGVLFGCGKAEPLPRLDGIVTSHADGYQSGTGHEFDLVRGNTSGGLYEAGRDYGDPEKVNWTSTIHWELKERRGKNDVYQFSWSFSPSGGAAQSQVKTVEYGGTKSVIVFQNEWQTISIEPGSIPLSENAQPSMPGDD